MATILGNDNSNLLSGTSGNDSLMGDGGLLDIINGGSGQDKAVYQGSVLDYSFASVLGQLFILDSNFSRDGLDWLLSVEYLQFDTSVNDFKNNVNHNASLYHLIIGNNSGNILNGDTVGALTNQDLMLGFSGSDTFNLGGGMDVAYGYGGNDTFNYNVLAANGVASYLGHAYLDGGANTDTLKLDFTGFAANGLTVAALQAAFAASAANPNHALDFSTIDSRIHLKIVGIENLVITNLVEVVNQAPVAAADSYSTNEDTALTIPANGVLANDSDPDGNPLTAVLVTGPANGTLSLNADGAFVYTPNANFNGSDSFVYRANDGALNSADTTVTISVAAVNDAPVAAADSYSTNEDTALTIPANGVLANDSDPDGNPLTAVLVTGPANGTLSLNADGAFVYTPNANFNGSDSFVYRANDGSLNSADTTVTISVAAVNDAPVAAADTYSINEDTTLAIPANVLVNDSDPEGNLLTAILVTGPAHGTFFLNVDGAFVYTPNANFNGSDSFVYRANDGSLNSADTTVTINVAPVNDAPVLNPIPGVNILEGTGASVATSFVDPDVGDSHIFSLIGAPSWIHIDANTGQLTVDPQVFAGNTAVIQDVTVRVTDAAGAFSEQNFNVLVEGNPRLFDTQVDDGSTRTLTNLATGTPDFTIWHMPAHNPTINPEILGNMLSVSVNALNRYTLTMNDGTQFGRVTMSDIVMPAAGSHVTVQIGLDTNNDLLITGNELVNVDLFTNGSDFDVPASAFLQLTGNVNFLLDDNDAVIGTMGNDYINAGEGDDLVRGDGEGLLNQTGGNDTLIGGGGNDLLHGDALAISNNSRGGNDTLIGDGGNDFLYGDGSIMLNSVAGVDIINGGKGNDTLSGDFESNFGGNTFASDTFVFNLAGGGDGNDNIVDFNAGGVGDKLMFTGVTDVNSDTFIDVNDVLAMSRVVDNSGRPQLQFTFDGGISWGTASINFNNNTFDANHDTLQEIMNNNLSNVIVTA